MTVDVPLLRKAIEWAEAEDRARGHKKSQWDQSTWVDVNDLDMTYNMTYTLQLTEMNCNTTCCIAGWLGFLSLKPGESINGHGGIVNADGLRVEHCSHRAQRLLGLTEQQAWDLFYTSQDIESLRATAERIAGEPL